ncbi:MAG: hypothetical protein AAGC74_09915, partial [Verrucomicrobiota bacterium]
MKLVIALLLILANPLLAVLPNLTQTNSLFSETTNTDGDTVFAVTFTITNGSTFHLSSARLNPSNTLILSLTELNDFEFEAEDFTDFGLPPSTTGTTLTRTFTCDPADATAIRNALNAGTFFDSAPEPFLDTLRYPALDLTLATPTLASETTEPDGRIKLTFTISTITNTGSNHFLNLIINPNLSLLSNYQTSGSINFRYDGYLAPNSTFTLNQSDELIVEATDRNAIVALLTNPDNYLLTGEEIVTGGASLMPLDPDTIVALQSTNPLNLGPADNPITLIFTDTPFLSRVQAGHRVLHPGLFTFIETLETALPGGLTEDVPTPIEYRFVVDTKSSSGGTTTLTGFLEKPSAQSGFLTTRLNLTTGSYTATGAYRAQNQFVIEGLYEKPFETNFPPDTQTRLNSYYQRGKINLSDNSFTTVAESRIGHYIAAFSPEPHVIDNLTIAPGVTLSGTVIIQALDIDFDIAWKNAAPRQLTARATSKLFLNLVIETRDGADNLSAPDIEKKLSLLNLDLPLITIPLPAPPNFNLYLSPSINFDLNTSVLLPGKATIPVQTGVIFGGEMTYANGSITTTGISEVLPPLISKAELQQALQAQATLGLSADLGINARIAILPTDPHSLDLDILSGNLNFGADLDTTFTLDPLGNPWWDLDGQLQLNTSSTLSSFGISLAQNETNLGNPVSLFNLNAGGPQPPSTQSSSTQSSSTDLSPELGEDLRWSTLLPTNKATTSGIPLVRALPDGTSYTLTPIISTLDHLTKIDPLGNIIYNLSLSTAATNPVSLTILPDLSPLIISLSSSKIITLTKLNPDGTLAWEQTHEYDTGDLELFKINDSISTTENGQTVIYLCGEEAFSQNALLLKFDATGNPLFQKTYPATNDTLFQAIHIATNGDLLLAGDTNVHPAASPFNSNNGLLTRLAPDGTHLWSRLIYSQDGNLHYDLTEDPATGDIYTVGHHFGTITRPHTGIQICKWTSDGLLHKRIILEPEIDGLRDAFNYANSCFFAHNTLFLGGRLELGTKASTFLARINPNMGLLFFSTIDGIYEDSVPTLAPTNEGFLLASNHAALNPWSGDGSTNPNVPGTGAHTLISLVPWEGLQRFHPLSGLTSKFHPAYTFATFDVLDLPVGDPNGSDLSEIHSPGLFWYLQQSNFNITTPADPLFPNNNSIGSAEEAFDHPFATPLDLTVTPATRTLPITTLPINFLDISDIPHSAINSYPAWESWQGLLASQIGTNNDPDNDKRSNILEAFAGSNPLLPDPEPLLTISPNPYPPTHPLW